MNPIPEQNEDEDLVFTRAIRKNMVTSMMKDGKVPNDTETLRLLQGVLTDMDRTSLAKKKIKSDEGISNNAALAAAALTNALLDPRIKLLGLAREGEQGVVPVFADRALPPAVPGELDEHPVPMDYASFTQKNEN